MLVTMRVIEETLQNHREKNKRNKFKHLGILLLQQNMENIKSIEVLSEILSIIYNSIDKIQILDFFRFSRLTHRLQLKLISFIQDDPAKYTTDLNVLEGSSRGSIILYKKLLQVSSLVGFATPEAEHFVIETICGDHFFS